MYSLVRAATTQLRWYTRGRTDIALLLFMYMALGSEEISDSGRATEMSGQRLTKAWLISLDSTTFLGKSKSGKIVGHKKWSEQSQTLARQLLWLIYTWMKISSLPARIWARSGRSCRPSSSWTAPVARIAARWRHSPRAQSWRSSGSCRWWTSDACPRSSAATDERRRKAH